MKQMKTAVVLAAAIFTGTGTNVGTGSEAVNQAQRRMIAQDHGTGWDDRDVTDAKLSALAHVIAREIGFGRSVLSQMAIRGGSKAKEAMMARFESAIFAKRTKQWMGECANTITADTCTVSRDYTCSAKTTDVFACQTDVTMALAGKKITNVDMANKKVTYASDGTTQITADKALADAVTPVAVTYTGPDGDGAYTYSTEAFVESLQTTAIDAYFAGVHTFTTFSECEAHGWFVSADGESCVLDNQ